MICFEYTRYLFNDFLHDAQMSILLILYLCCKLWGSEWFKSGHECPDERPLLAQGFDDFVDVTSNTFWLGSKWNWNDTSWSRCMVKILSINPYFTPFHFDQAILIKCFVRNSVWVKKTIIAPAMTFNKTSLQKKKFELNMSAPVSMIFTLMLLLAKEKSIT